MRCLEESKSADVWHRVENGSSNVMIENELKNEIFNETTLKTEEELEVSEIIVANDQQQVLSD